MVNNNGIIFFLQELKMKLIKLIIIRLVLSTLAIISVSAHLYLTQAATYNLTVQADKRTQPWNRYYEMGVATCHMNTIINTYWGRGISNALKIGHDEAGFSYFRGHGILNSDIALVDTNKDGTLKLNWTRFDSVYNLAIRAGLRPILEISTTPPALASGNDLIGTSGTVWYGGAGPNRSVPNKGGWGRWLMLMDSIVTHCEKKWGVEEVRNNWFFEVWNEPTWWYMGFEKYFDLYDYTVTGLKNGDSLVRVGGPAAEGTNTITGGREFQLLLDHCRSGTNAATDKTGTAIDFLTYHWYSNNSVPIGITGALLNANNLVTMHKAVTDTLRKNYSWFNGPVFIDEYGPSSSTPVCRDHQASATWIIKTVHLLNEGGPQYPPPPMLAYWALSDLYEEFQNKLQVLSFQEGNYGMFLRGSPSYQNSWDIPKPPFQAYRLLHWLGDFEIQSSGGTTGSGVNLVATCDSNNNKLQILVYNHYASISQSSAPADSVILTVSAIPWKSGTAMVEHYCIDTTHSNSYTAWVGMGKPSAPSNAQWDALRGSSQLERYDSTMTATLTGNSFSKTFKANYYSVHLLLVSNPKPTLVKKSEKQTRVSEPGDLRVLVGNGKIRLVMPEKGYYTASFYTISGQKIFEAAEFGPGDALISIPKIPASAFVLQCRSEKVSFGKKIFVWP
jgi:xylan 1,4-beta-xylosidase